MTIVEFLRGRHAEMRTQAELLRMLAEAMPDGEFVKDVADWMDRDREAKEWIVDEYADKAHYDTEDWGDEGASGRIHGLGEALRSLARVDSDHPDYDPEWAEDT